MSEPFKLQASLAAKVGSILVHVEEFMDDGHEFDVAAMRALLGNDDVQEWIAALRKIALVPVKRSKP